ncbi:hypothetical protein ACI8AA_14685 [Geodermatophilus sp. SYSU D01180]
MPVVRRQKGCALSALAVLTAAVLPWSSTAAAGRSGWGTASLALALGEALHRPLLTALACVWFTVPLASAGALLACVLLPRRSAVVALHTAGVLVVLVVLTVLIALHVVGLDVVLPGPILALAGGAALVALPARPTPDLLRRRDGAAVKGLRS